MLRLPTILRHVLVSVVMFASRLRGATPPSEFDLKAVFLFHFTQFVEWPQDAYSSDDAPFIIGVLGTDPFESSLTSIVRGESVGRHPIIVRDVRNESVERGCQILYVAKDGEPLLEFRRIRNAPILTVGESESFYQEGGVVQFYIDRRRLRLRINLEEARTRSLVISAKLLRVSEVTDGGSAFFDLSSFAGEPLAKRLEDLAEHRAWDLQAVESAGAEVGIAGMKMILPHGR
jgi:hypothetical protein